MRTRVYKSKEKSTKKSPFISSRENPGFFNVQTKLNIGKPNDVYEQEAEKVADSVVKNRSKNNISTENGKVLQQKSNEILQEKALAESITPFVQKQEEEEEIQPKRTEVIQKQEEEELETVQAQAEEEEEMLQAQVEEEEEEVIQAQEQTEEEEIVQAQEEAEEEEMLQGQAEEKEEPVQMQEEEEEMIQPKQSQNKPNGQEVATPSVESKLKNRGSSGNKMDDVTRAEMESSFGADFSRVKIHTDNEAVQLSKELGAQAFTHGNDVYFNKGKYNPDSKDGKHLLAHELTHTIQQTGLIPGKLQLTINDNRDLQSGRFSGDLILEACLDGEQTLSFGSRGAAVSKMQQALVDAGFPLPVYGVDGIFEAETQGALQNFQRSSSLSPTGVLDAATMSSLDALFYLDQPMLSTGPAANIAPEISSDTLNFAPSSADTTRTNLGVGERVRFYGNTAGTWTATEGRIIGLNNGENMVWEAPAVAANPTITLTTPGGTASINMTVITPSSLIMTFDRNENIPAGTAGACMITEVVLHPLNVNFGRVQFAEIPGPASDVAGYFNRFPAANLAHTTAGHYVPFNDDNAGVIDHAYYHSLPAPYSAGIFRWVIPNRYKIDGESDAQGRFFTDTTQSFYITSTGSLLITKAGTFVLRFVNDTVLHGL